MKREYHKWFSPALGRDMELLHFGNKGKRMLVFPTRKNRFFEYEDHGMIHALRHQITDGKLQVICVDGLDDESLYCFDKAPEARIQRHMQYERYIIEEVLPFIRKLKGKGAILSHGCSFGAYHALTIAARHPAHFSTVAAFSGRYDLTLDSGDFHTLFYGFYDESLYHIMPSHFVPNLPSGRVLRAMRKVQFTMVIGEEDPFYENNVALAKAFSNKGIKHQLHSWVGNAHRWRYWRQMARVYIPGLL